jgi:hypothetical protein
LQTQITTAITGLVWSGKFSWCQVSLSGKLLLAFVSSFFVLGSAALMTKFFSLVTLGVLQRLIAAALSVGQFGNLLLAIISTVILGSVSRGTHDHILLLHDS